MPFTKGNSGNPLGRPKGSLNHSTKEVRELLSSALDTNKIKEMLERIEEPTDYINAITKLLPYCVPKVKPIDAEMDDREPIVINLHLKDDNY